MEQWTPSLSTLFQGQKPPWGSFRTIAALVESGPRSRGPVSRPVSALSPVAAVGEAASQLQRGGGGAVPGHPRWSALHGRRPGALQDLRRGGELWEPEGLPVRQAHRLQWFHYKVGFSQILTKMWACSLFDWAVKGVDSRELPEENQTVKWREKKMEFLILSFILSTGARPPPLIRCSERWQEVAGWVPFTFRA